VDEERRLDDALRKLTAPATLWWRDDDAGKPHPGIDRLLGLAERHRAPLALAVVPTWLRQSVAGQLLASPWATMMQHGHAHESHALGDARKTELGGDASLDSFGPVLIRDRERLADTFGNRFLHVMVPPWNRISPPFLMALSGWDFAGVSTFAQPAAILGGGLRRVDTHLDVIAWRSGGGFIGYPAMIERLIALVEIRGIGPIGILTHHRVMDDLGFEGLDRFLALVQDHPKLRLESASGLFMEAG
jgi:hypothetical protein